MFCLWMQLLQAFQLFFHELIVGRGLAFSNRLYYFLYRFFTGFLSRGLCFFNSGFDEEGFQLVERSFDFNQGKHLSYQRLLIG